MISAPTEFGWAGIMVGGQMIHRIKFGFPSEIALLRSFDEHFDVRRPKRNGEYKWLSCIQKFLDGNKVDLSTLPVDFEGFTNFQKSVLMNCQKISYGRTLSYGQLAAKSKSPRAARAVGSIMKINRVPLVIPCHRVVASNGIGGYSAGDGIEIKRKLLAMEGVAFKK